MQTISSPSWRGTVALRRAMCLSHTPQYATCQAAVEWFASTLGGGTQPSPANNQPLRALSPSRTKRVAPAAVALRATGQRLMAPPPRSAVRVIAGRADPWISDSPAAGAQPGQPGVHRCQTPSTSAGRRSGSSFSVGSSVSSCVDTRPARIRIAASSGVRGRSPKVIEYRYAI